MRSLPPRLLPPLALTLGAGLLLSACGTTEVDDAAETTATASESCAEDTTATSTDPVSITDALGREVELDKPAERIAVLEWQQIEDALTLCVTPVAVSDPEGYNTWISAEPLPEDTPSTGNREEPDLDALYAQDPELIIIEAYDENDELLAQLEARDVPVLATKGADASGQIDNMKKTFSQIAEATGRTERGDQVLADFDARLAEAEEQVSDVELETTDFVYFDGWLDGSNLTIRPYGEGALFTELGEKLGLTAAWTEEINESYGSGGVDPSYGLAQTDVEGLTAVGEANLIYANDEGAGGYVAALEENEIWQNLPAVQEGRAYAFPPSVWGAGGPRSTLQAVDAYVEILTGESGEASDEATD